MATDPHTVMVENSNLGLRLRCLKHGCHYDEYLSRSVLASDICGRAREHEENS